MSIAPRIVSSALILIHLTMSDLINITTPATDVDKSPLTFDHDSRKLTIIYGTLATLIALLGLVFAALTWYAPRRLAHRGAPNEHDLESNMTQHVSRRSTLSALSGTSNEHGLESNTSQHTFRQSTLLTQLRASNECDLDRNMSQHTAPSVRSPPMEVDTGPRYAVLSDLATSALAYLQQQYKTYNTSTCQYFVSTRT